MDGRKSAYWMMQVDERILDYLDQEDWATPRMMARDRCFSVSEGFIWERCQMLRYVGFIAQFGRDMYELTNDGKLYLQGEIDAQHRPTPTVDRVLRR
ncbi:hypothetical protein [Halomicrobium urmianum]|uniref:hypothetical protein n=1 Tax=Halomicrobium urmianum TaxID=1586233 RepID=UPI001CD92AEC|nr:hypothetical protein [Halomicrobium urmianum]